MASPVPHDALSLLRHDHRALQHLSLALDESEDSEEQQMALEALVGEWTLHTQLEKQVFYPAIRKSGLAVHSVDQAEELLDDTTALLPDLEQGDSQDPQFLDKLTEFEDNVLRHIQNDESDVYSQIEQTDLDLEELGQALRDFKETSSGKRR